MAWVHTRIAFLFFVHKSPTGAIATAHKVHAHPKLNHHFRAFHVTHR